MPANDRIIIPIVSSRLGAAESKKTTFRQLPPKHGKKDEQKYKRHFIAPELAMLLAEPEVRLLMQADSVNERELLAILRSASTQLRKNTVRAKRARKRSRRSGENYRPGVGVMLLNSHGQIFVGRRIDSKNAAWQMPQGGINPGESPRDAALRELKEEIGTNDVEVIAESNQWLYYEVPESMAGKAWGGRWKGQCQKWFVMLLKAPDSAIHIATEHPEFDAWRWVSLQTLSDLAVSFKRQLYVDVVGEFATVFRD